MLLLFLLVEAAILIHLSTTVLLARLSGVACESVRMGIGPRIAGFTRGGTAYELCALPVGSSAKFEANAFPALSRGRRLLIAAAPLAAQLVLGVLLIGGLPAAGDALAAFACGTVHPSAGGAALAEFARGVGAAPAAAFGAVLVCSAAHNAVPLHLSSGGRIIALVLGADDCSLGRAMWAWFWASLVLQILLFCSWGWALVTAIAA